MKEAIISICNKSVRSDKAGKLCLDEAKDVAHSVWIAKKIFKEQYGNDLIFHIYIDGEPVNTKDPLFSEEHSLDIGIHLSMTAIDAKTLRRINYHLLITRLDEKDFGLLNLN